MARVARQGRLRERRRRVRAVLPRLLITPIRPYPKATSTSRDTAHCELEARKSSAGATPHGTRCLCAESTMQGTAVYIKKHSRPDNFS